MVETLRFTPACSLSSKVRCFTGPSIRTRSSAFISRAATALSPQAVTLCKSFRSLPFTIVVVATLSLVICLPPLNSLACGSR